MVVALDRPGTPSRLPSRPRPPARGRFDRDHRTDNMPAAEETYRRQPALHIIFAISSIAMTLSIIWMIMADHLRPWKQVQREFQVFEREKLKAAEQATLEKRGSEVQSQIDEFDRKIKEAEQGADQHAAELSRLDKELKGLQAKTEKLDTQRQVQEGRAR